MKEGVCKMKNHRRLIIVLVSAIAVVTISMGVLANSHSGTLATSDGNLTYNSSDTEVVYSGDHTCRYRVSSFRFHGGLPADIFPSGKNCILCIANIGVSKKYTTADKQYKTNNYHVTSPKTAYAGVKTNHSLGITIYAYWDPNY